MGGAYALTRAGHGNHARWKLIRLDPRPTEPEFGPAKTKPRLRLIKPDDRSDHLGFAHDGLIRRVA